MNVLNCRGHELIDHDIVESDIDHENVKENNNEENGIQVGDSQALYQRLSGRSIRHALTNCLA